MRGASRSASIHPSITARYAAELRCRPRLRRPIRRRHRRLQRLPDRPPMHPMPARQLPDRQFLPRVIAPDRLELLHSSHDSFRPLAWCSTEHPTSGPDRTEVGPLQASTPGPRQTSTPSPIARRGIGAGGCSRPRSVRRGARRRLRPVADSKGVPIEPADPHDRERGSLSVLTVPMTGGPSLGPAQPNARYRARATALEDECSVSVAAAVRSGLTPSMCTRRRTGCPSCGVRRVGGGVVFSISPT